MPYSQEYIDEHKEQVYFVAGTGYTIIFFFILKILG